MKMKILKATGEKQQKTSKGIPIKISPDYVAETLRARRKCHNILKVMKGRDLQPRILCPASLLLTIERKSFIDKQKVRVQHQ